MSHLHLCTEHQKIKAPGLERESNPRPPDYRSIARTAKNGLMGKDQGLSGGFLDLHRLQKKSRTRTRIADVSGVSRNSAG